MLGSGETIKHYSNLYDCKYFRNRVLRLQALCQQLNLDAILLINGKHQLDFFSQRCLAGNIASVGFLSSSDL